MADTTTLNGRATFWSLDHDACIGWGNPEHPNACKFPGSPHKEGGRCMRCASRHASYMADQGTLTTAIAAPPIPEKRWSRNHDACIGWDDRNTVHHACATPHSVHASHGRCVNCAQKQVKEAEIAATVAPAPQAQPAADLATAARATVHVPRQAQEPRPSGPVFAVFTQVGPTRQTGPTLTLRKDGSLTINAAAYALLGAPTHVELVYAASEHLLGIRPCFSEVPHARALRPEKSGQLRYVSVRALLATLGLTGSTGASEGTRQYGDVLALPVIAPVQTKAGR